jgi:O-acetyl-ADP-ribose deacetylase (regulator of RNase III)
MAGLRAASGGFVGRDSCGGQNESMAAPVALETVVEFLKTHPGALDEVRFVLYTPENEAAYAIFCGALEQIIGLT